MRQAGRCLPQYRKVRRKVSGFKELVETPELACEVTLQPVNFLGVDAAIIFSDILVIPQAMGLKYDIVEDKGPLFEHTIRSDRDVEKLRIADPIADLSYVLDAIRLVKKELNGRVPLICFAGAPWTIFAYMLEGKGSKSFSAAKRMLYANAGLSHRLLQMITDSTIAYLRAQINAGADIVQIFDSWAGVLTPKYYNLFSLTYIAEICNALKKSHPATPIIVFPKDAYFVMSSMSEIKCEVVGLDWTMDITDVRKLLGEKKTIQGNLDPCVLYADENTIRHETHQMLSAAGKHRYIANLGHGIYPDTDAGKVKCFVNAVKEYSFDKPET